MNAQIITLKLRIDKDPPEQYVAATELMHKLACLTPGVQIEDIQATDTFYVKQTDAAKAGKAAV